MFLLSKRFFFCTYEHNFLIMIDQLLDFYFFIPYIKIFLTNIAIFKIYVKRSIRCCDVKRILRDDFIYRRFLIYNILGVRGDNG